MANMEDTAETSDGRKPNDGLADSQEMHAVKRAFSRAHAMSIHLNLITIGATLWYGWRLASKLGVDA